MVCDWGMSEKLGPLHFGKREGEVFLGRDFGDGGKDYSEQTAIEIDSEVRKIVQANYDRARKVVMDNLDKLKLLAEALLEFETVDGAEIDTIFAGRPARSQAVDLGDHLVAAQDRRQGQDREARHPQHLRPAAPAARSREGVVRTAATATATPTVPNENPLFRSRGGEGFFLWGEGFGAEPPDRLTSAHALPSGRRSQRHP